MPDVAVVSVVATALVAIAGVLVPAFLRRGDRRHELRVLRETKHVEWRAEWWNRRELAYVETLRESEWLFGALAGLRVAVTEGSRTATARPHGTASASSGQTSTVEKEAAALLAVIEAILERERPYDVDAYGSDGVVAQWRALLEYAHSQLRMASQTLRLILSETASRPGVEEVRQWAEGEGARTRAALVRAADSAQDSFRDSLSAKIREELAAGPEAPLK